MQASAYHPTPTCYIAAFYFYVFLIFQCCLLECSVVVTGHTALSSSSANDHMWDLGASHLGGMKLNNVYQVLRTVHKGKL